LSKASAQVTIDSIRSHNEIFVALTRTVTNIRVAQKYEKFLFGQEITVPLLTV
jgi:hypothetical protein